MLSLPVADSPHMLGALDFRAHSIAHARICALSIEHDDLDAAIAAAGPHDDLTVARLKKRQLQIEDEIAGLVAAGQTQGAHEEAGRQNAADGEVPAKTPAKTNMRRQFRYEGAAARYRALMVKTCDPARRRMLEEMIARELEWRRDHIAPPAQGMDATGAHSF